MIRGRQRTRGTLGRGMVVLTAACLVACPQPSNEPALELPATQTLTPERSGDISSLALASHAAVVVRGAVYEWPVTVGGEYVSMQPTRRGTLDDAVQVSASWDYTCALRANGEVMCIGDKVPTYLKFFNGDHTRADDWIALDGFTGITEVRAGNFHLCARRFDGRVVCTGSNHSGQCGTPPALLQVKSHVVVESLTDVESICVGSYFNCALHSSRELSCWGDNEYYQLGANNASRTGVPVKIEGIANVRDFSCGDGHICVVTEQSTVKCWGRNDYNQLAAAAPDKVSPREAVTISTQPMRSVSLRGDTSCALTDRGRVLCWGFNSFGMLGDRRVTTTATPGEIPGLPEVLAVEAGMGHACAILPGDRGPEGVWCWGGSSDDGGLVLRPRREFVPPAPSG